MANTIKLKNSGTASATPSALEYGELGLNYADGKIFYKNSLGNIVEFTIATENLNAHETAHAATTEALPNSPAYTAGSADGNNGYGVGAYLQASTYGALSIDSHALSAGERILVKNQVNEIHNGIYTVTSIGNGSSYWRLTRSLDFDNSSGPEVSVGDYVYISQGVTNSASSWMMNSYGTNIDKSIKIGTDNIIWYSVGVGPPGPAGATGAGGALGYYGAFQDDLDQLAALATEAYAVKLRVTDEANGISMAANTLGDLTRITFAHQGTYNIVYSLQTLNPSNLEVEFDVWFRKNNVDIPNSNSHFSAMREHAGINGMLIVTLSYIVTLAANDFVEVMWHTESTAAYLAAVPAGTTPASPLAPSAIVSVQQVMYTQVGPTGATGAQGPQGEIGPTGITYQTFTVPSVLNVGTGKARFYAYTPYTIANVSASVGTAPAGADIIVDVLKNNSTIFTTTANRPTITIGSFSDASSIPDVLQCNMISGDYLTISIAQVGTSIKGSDLTVQITLQPI